MSWLSSGIGAGIGFALGGPIGAAIGIFIGSSMSPKKIATAKRANQTIFFVSLFSMLGKMAKADGVILESEINAIKNFMTTMRLDEKDKQYAVQIFNNAKDDTYSIYDYAKQYKKNSSFAMREMLYTMLWDVAAADEDISEQEDAILQKIPSHLGLNDNIYYQFKTGSSTASGDLNTHYKMLDCENTDTDATIRKKYKKAVLEYHPDKIQSKGLPKKFIKFANEQTKKINKAYEAIKKERSQKERSRTYN